MCLYVHPPPHGVFGYMHIGVGIEVAYLPELGKFDGPKSEIGSSTILTLFWAQRIYPVGIKLELIKNKV